MITILQPTKSCLPGPIKVLSHSFLGLWHPLFLHSSRNQSCLMLALTAFTQNLLGSFHAVCVMCLRGVSAAEPTLDPFPQKGLRKKVLNQVLSFLQVVSWSQHNHSKTLV